MKKLIIPLMALLSSCGSGFEAFSDHDKSVNLQDYKTYSWQNIQEIESKGSNPLYYNELNDKRIKEAVNAEMGKRGFSEINKDGQLQLHYHILVEDKIESSIEPAGVQYNNRIANPKQLNIYQYRQGTLIVDIMDAKKNILVWRGWATDVITNSMKKNPEAAISQAVAAIFKKFPG